MRNLFRSFFPSKTPHVVLGRKLQPFSNWHRLQLQHLKSPCMGFPGELDVAALTVAVSVCVTQYPNSFLPPDGALEGLLLRRAQREALRDILPARRAWRNYLLEFCAQPQVFIKQNTKNCQCPGPLAAWAALKLRGDTREEAWNAPVGRGSWERLALAEAEGTEINLLTDEARHAMIKAGWGKVMPELLLEDE